MRKVWQFIRTPIGVDDSQFKLFFRVLFLTTLLAYAPAIMTFLPGSIAGFNWSGIAWVIMFLFTIAILPKRNGFTFPIRFWLPWMLYLGVSIVLDFSFVGLQLTIQYILPLLLGVVASSFEYNATKILWLFQGLLKTTVVVYGIFVIYTSLYGYMPHMAATPMLFAVGAVISLGVFFFIREKIYVVAYLLLFLMPFVHVTRMGLLVFGMIFILHFANKGIGSKVLASFAGGILMLFVVNSEGFQEKTFYDGQGDVTEISLDYYENNEINSSGRSSWKRALAPGIEEKPIWGNGPRADASVLGAVMGKEVGEAHNDYLSVRYNYGLIGLALLLFGFAGIFFKTLCISQKLDDPLFQLLVLSLLTLFIPFLLFMYSDNILKYTIWFPNYFFALMGIVYSMYKKGYTYD